VLKALGSRADANSGGEIEVALRAGFAPREVVFTGVGKTVESWTTPSRATSAPSTRNLRASSIGLRAGAGSRPRRPGRSACEPGHRRAQPPEYLHRAEEQQVRVALQDARGIYRDRLHVQSLQFVGVHIHIGSQITTAEPLRRAAAALTTLALELRGDGVPLEHVDLAADWVSPTKGGR
jgi:diaminopimelate decarboxylase